MRILHLDLPRALSTTVKPIDFRAARDFELKGAQFQSADINLHFWCHLLAEAGASTSIEDLFDAEALKEAIGQVCQALDTVSGRCQVRLTPFGFDFGPEAASTLNIPKLIAGAQFREFIRRYVTTLHNALEFDAYDIVSLGIGSPNGVVLSCAFAEALRELLGKRVRIVLGKHGYENFSLRFRRDEIERSGILRRYFDCVAYNEEEVATTVAGGGVGIVKRRAACSHSDATGTLSSSPFLKLLPIAPQQCVVLMPLSRNKCYWKRCSFCAQIHKHASDSYYKNASEIADACDELAALTDAGFRYFILNDEAISPANLRRLCAFLEQSELSICWTPRIIADVDFDAELIQRMKRNGCIEVLFGLETVSKKTAHAMGKVSSGASKEEITALLKRFGDAGIGLFVNFIYAFPTESDAEFEESFAFWNQIKDEVKGITVNFNKFELYYGTDMYRDPQRYRLRNVEEATSANDLKMAFGYEDEFGRQGSAARNETYFSASLGLTKEGYCALTKRAGKTFVDTAFQLNYASFGLIHKHRTGVELIGNVI